MKSKFKRVLSKKLEINPIHKIREWNERILDKVMDVDNFMKMSNGEPSKEEWDSYKKLSEAHSAMSIWLGRLEQERYFKYYTTIKVDETNIKKSYSMKRFKIQIK